MSIGYGDQQGLALVVEAVRERHATVEQGPFYARWFPASKGRRRGEFARLTVDQAKLLKQTLKEEAPDENGASDSVY